MAGDMPGFEFNRNGLEYTPFIDLTRQYPRCKYAIKLAIDQVLTSRIYAPGSAAEAFETELADYYGTSSCISPVRASVPDLLLNHKARREVMWMPCCSELNPREISEFVT